MRLREVNMKIRYYIYFVERQLYYFQNKCIPNLQWRIKKDDAINHNWCYMEWPLMSETGKDQTLVQQEMTTNSCYRKWPQICATGNEHKCVLQEQCNLEEYLTYVTSVQSIIPEESFRHMVLKGPKKPLNES